MLLLRRDSECVASLLADKDKLRGERLGVTGGEIAGGVAMFMERLLRSLASRSALSIVVFFELTDGF